MLGICSTIDHHAWFRLNLFVMICNMDQAIFLTKMTGSILLTYCFS
jgi:hypothetical protein